jgi:peptidoglycan/LPS O-acetylase OafA/YrhL
MRLCQLDILRGVAVILVLFRHAPQPEPEVAEPVQTIVLTLVDVGWIGVDLFFVLSGFLVSGLLFTEYRRYGAPARARFWVRRGFKIYPAFWVMILVTCCMYRWGHPAPEDPAARLLHELLYVQNYWDGLWNHTWSLAVEEHFYLGLPLLLALLARGGPDPFRRSWLVLPLLTLAVLGWRVATVAEPQPFRPYLFVTHMRIDSLLWGVLLAYAYHFRDRAWLTRLRRWWPLVAVAIAVLLAPAVVGHIGESLFLATWGLTTIALGFTLLVALTLAPTAASPARRTPLPFVGTAVAAIGVDSYSIYLWHKPVERWVMPWLRNAFELPGADLTFTYVRDLAEYLVVAVVVGMALARVIERPALALRERLAPSRTRAVEAETTTLPAVELVTPALVDARP